MIGSVYSWVNCWWAWERKLAQVRLDDSGQDAGGKASLERNLVICLVKLILVKMSGRYHGFMVKLG